MNDTTLCNLCPRACMVDRSVTRGVCGVGLQSIIARAAPASLGRTLYQWYTRSRNGIFCGVQSALYLLSKL